MNVTARTRSVRDFVHKIAANRRWSVMAAAVALLVIAAIILYLVRIERSISGNRERQQAEARVEVEEHSLRALSTDGMTLYLNSTDARAVTNFHGIRYVATSGGLLVLDDAGNLRRRYTTFDRLPENDLTTLAVFRDRLFMGTASSGLVAFDGSAFTSYRFTKPKATRVSVLITTESELLIGTLDGGLLEYDGARFTRRFNSAQGADFKAVTALMPFESRLYIGTHNDGLYVWREAHIEHLTMRDGLPSPHVTAITALPASLADRGSIAVATDFAVVVLDNASEIKAISNRPNVTSLAVSNGHLWAGLFSGGIVDLSADATQSGEKRYGLSDVAGLPASAPAIVFSLDRSLWALTREGAFVRDEGATRPAFESVAVSAGDRVLTAGHITTLAVGDAGRLWVGYFDHGIDVVHLKTSERLTHIEDDRVREINYLTLDTESDRMLVATSRGLVSLGSDLKQTVTTGENGGLVNDSVAHVLLTKIDFQLLASARGTQALSSRAMVLATAGGLTEIIGGRARSLTAFHGLASNHLYTAAAVGTRLFVGSLAGLVELEGLRVVRTYKTSNSRLSHDWVTALDEADSTLYVGTNGGGVDALMPTGEFVNFADELGKFEVNQNAMHHDDQRLYVGTTDRGLLVYHPRDRRWARISAGLASQSVTAITSDDRFVYVGTMNGLVRIEKRVIE